MMNNLITNVVREVFGLNDYTFDEENLVGGLTNKNFKIDINDKSYILRIPGACTDVMIDRVSEEMNNKIASDLGINANCIYFDNKTGIKITEFIENARTLNHITCKTEENLLFVANVLKKIHNSEIKFKNKFDFFYELEKYEKLVTDKKLFNFYKDYDKEKNLFLAEFKNFICENPLDYKSCHNDCVCENFVSNGSRLYLIDWEYSGLNDPSWDFASYILENSLSKEEYEKLLGYYYGNKIPYEKIEMFKHFQDLLWSVWSIAKCCNGEDYLEYGIDRYNRFIKNRVR